MTKRLQLLFDEIENCEVFADVGCDHGYIAEAVLKSCKSEKVIISDIEKLRHLEPDYASIYAEYSR